jgi:hypothetical protein
MSSNYTYHFVYETTNLVNGKVYRGVHSTNNLEDGYVGSGVRIRRAVQKYGKENFSRVILFFANNRESADWAEEQLVNDEWLLTNKNRTYNIAVGGTRMHSYRMIDGQLRHRTEGKITAKRKDTGEYIQVDAHIFYSSPELYEGTTRGLVAAINTVTGKKETLTKDEYKASKHHELARGTGVCVFCVETGARVVTTKDDPRIASGQLIYKSAFESGTVAVKDVNGNAVRISVQEFAGGGYDGHTAGKRSAKDLSGRVVHVDINDPRFATGELLPYEQGITTVKDSDGNVYKVSVDDPRLKSGELVGVTKGRFPVYDASGNIVNVTKEEYLQNPQAYKRILSGRKRVYSADGKEVMLPADDPRILSGEFKTRKEWAKLNNPNIPQRKITRVYESKKRESNQ